MELKFFKVIKNIPTNCHNAEHDPDEGRVWPVGELFVELNCPGNWRDSKTGSYAKKGSKVLTQVGGEETILRISTEKFSEHFDSCEAVDLHPCHSLASSLIP